MEEASQQLPGPCLGAVATLASVDTPAAAIQLLAGRLLSRGLVGEADGFAAAVLLREQSATTALPIGMALPHARLARNGRIIVALGRHPTGLEWGGVKVRAVFLMAVPANQTAAYLAFVQRLVRRMRDGGGLATLDALPTEAACAQWLGRNLGTVDA